MLADVNVALGVSGSIAAVRCVELAHELRRAGASVRAVTTPSAEGIIHPWSLEYATDHPVTTEITGSVEHVELCGTEGWADVLLLAPATANTIGKIASAIDDTPVTTCATTALGAGIPLVIAPAMHQPMWDHPGVLAAIEQLEDWGVTIVPPNIEEGKAKLATDEAIVTAADRAGTEPTLGGLSVVVTSGPTTEAIDPVRVLTNHSSGRMGREVARACAVRGAAVTVIHDGADLPYAETRHVETGAEMRAAAVEACEDADVLVSAAAIGDFEIDTAPAKLDSSERYHLELQPASKLLDEVREACPDVAIVGFKAEHDAADEDLIEAARAQLRRVEATFVVANDASVMGGSATRVLLVDTQRSTTIAGSKRDVAEDIADRLAEAVASPEGT